MPNDLELRRLAEGATPGPWRNHREPPPVVNLWFDANHGEPVESRGTAFAFGVAVAVVAEKKDARYIAAVSPAVILDLLDRLEAAERERDRLKGEVFQVGVAWEMAAAMMLDRVEDYPREPDDNEDGTRGKGWFAWASGLIQRFREEVLHV